MGTRFAAYSLKLTSLHDYYQRLLHGSQPMPSGLDIANTLKYFSQTLLSLLKEVREMPFEMIKSQKFDGERMALYPNLDYKQLYNALTQLVDVVPLIHIGLQAFGKALLQCLACLLPFLDHDMIDNIPYLAASTISVLPMELHEEIVNYLCFYILPFTITRKIEISDENAASQSVAAVIMMVFQYSSNPAHHCQLLECLMALKSGVVKDILCVVAYGTAPARASAAKLLFYYWPSFNPNLFDRRAVLVKFANDLTPFVCQRDSCPNAGNAEAGKVCYDHRISITFATESPPPLYLCIECANEIHREHPNQMFYDILHPMQQVSMICENKNCRAADKSAISICFSTECASYNGNHPIRYCQQCHNIRHNNRRGGDHVYHMALPHISQLESQTQTYMVQAIVSLLKEAESLSIDNRDMMDLSSSTSNKGGTGFSGGGSGGGSSGGGVGSTFGGHCDSTSLEERQLLGRYGVWLLVGLCTPNEDTPVEILGRLLSMLFHWFHITAYSFDGTKKSLMHLIFSVGQAESALEKLKTEYVCGWLSEVMKTHYEVFISCLLPHPADYVRVGGHWETLASRTSHLKDGLNRLFCLVPYEVITPDIWDYVMPHWMEAIVNDVPEHELHELKMILCKILDPDMSPLGFDAKKMYNFVAKRFINTSAKVQEQALNWLQTLTMLQIMIPLSQLFAIFSDGVAVMQSMNSAESELKPSKSTKNGDGNITCPVVENESGKSTPLSDDMAPTPRHMEFMTNAELNLSCCILMLDILLKQMELQGVDKHTGINTWVCQDACHLMKSIVASNWNSCHTCNISDTECTYCESRVIWHQLCLQLITYIVPENPAYPPDTIVDETTDDHGRKGSPETTRKSDSKPDVVINMPVPEMHSVGGVLVHMPHIMTATVETVSEQLDLAAIMPTEKVMSAVARTVTLSETDVATATVSVAKPHLIGENDEPVNLSPETDLDDFWHTSVGKFRFTIEELPEYLQYIHKLLKEIMTIDKPDILYYMLQCLNILCLYGDAFNAAVKDHQGFFIWCQENLLIRNLWELLNAEHSHIAQVTVPLLLHCVTLPCGTDTFWRLVQEEFHNSDWRVRFVAVERVTLIARFMDSTPLRNISSLQAALANAFCYLITSMDDNNVYVAQRATLYLGTIHDAAVRSLILCLETQFDSVIVDRPMVLQSLYQLHNSLSDRRILTWEFFLNRFDALFLEAQINLEKSGDISYLRGQSHTYNLKNTDLNSEVFLKKLHRAHEALSQSDGSGTSSVKTLSASFGTKWPYKRTMSAPASMLPRQDTKQEKEKVYSRQYSAPILKRKSSRFGLGQLLESTPSNNSIPDGHIHSLNMVDEASTLPGYTHKIVDLEEADKETMHLLVFLLMQFLSRQDQAYPTDEKPLSRIQGIVLRHLYLLLGYNQTERTFHTSPQRLRLSPGFNVFIANLPQLLDQNHAMGLLMTSPVLAILQHCPCPPQTTPPTDHQPPSYSLWYLEPHIRRSWLMSLLVILYKCQYGQQPWCNQLQALVKIVLNTLETQHHQCKRIPATVVMGAPPSRSRDVSQPSLGVEHDLTTNAVGEIDTETPPTRPLWCPIHQRSPGGIHGQMETHWEEDNGPACRYFNKHFITSYSVNADDTESELAAIPESPKSDSTLHGSSGGSLGELENTVQRSAVLQEPRTSIILDETNVIIDPNNRNSSKLRMESVTKPIWFLGNEDESSQGYKKVEPQKKWSVYEGVKMMVTSTFLTGQQEPAKFHSKISALPVKNAKGQLPYNGDTISSKPFDLSSALAVATSISHIQRSDSIKKKNKQEDKIKEKGREKEKKENETEKVTEKDVEKQKEKALILNTVGTVINTESPNAKYLGRQKHVEQITITATSPVSPCQVITVTNSDHSSSPALSSISSQVVSTENEQPTDVLNTLQPLITTPTVERLLPIGTIVRATGPRTTQRVLRCEDTYGSPESPLSKMDILTVSSSFEQDSETCVSSDITSPHSVSQLEFPTPERLLPVGPLRDFSSLVERVCQALEISDIQDTNKSNEDAKRDTMILMKQDSRTAENMSTSLIPAFNEVNSSRSPSPRRLIKQLALESSPPTVDSGDFLSKITDYDQKLKSKDQFRIQRDKTLKITNTNTDQDTITDARRPESWSGPQVQQNLDFFSQQAYHADFNLKQSLFRIGDDCVYDRCSECGTIKEEYSDEELGLCIITLGTFIHREPSLAAPLLPEILGVVTKIALNAMYPWQSETNMHLPGGAVSVAHQFLRCVLHQLAPNGVFMQMFQTNLNETTRLQFFKSVAQALIDFNELNPIAPLQLLLETLNMKKSLPLERLPIILYNIACYLDCLPLEAGLGPGVATWSGLLAQFDGLFRRLVLMLPSIEDITPLLRIMISILKVPGIQQSKGMLDPLSKVLSYAIQNSTLQYHYLTDLCYLCHRGFTRDRDKHFFGRTIVFELIQAIKFKITIPDSNFLLLLQFALQDIGGSLPSTITMENYIQTDISPIYNTNASESLKNQLSDVLDFLADFHTLSKIKSYSKGMQAGLNEDTLGGMLKCGLAQYVALEITRGNNRENKAVARYLPWLYTTPSTIQGAREYIDCIGHIRLLSWLLLGSLTHIAMHTGNNNNHSHNSPISFAQPIPQEVSCHIADHIQIIFSGFPEQSKTSVLHMSSLFHAFILCQLWTMYLEELSKNNASNSEGHNITMNILLEFWGKITPCILQLVSYSKALSEMLNLHFLSLLEALLECGSILLSKLLPLWNAILFSHHVQLPGHLQVRLQNCRDFPPSRMTEHFVSNRRESNAILLQWLHRLQFKMGQIEMQSSTATQFYSI
ncbi:protein unc-79 homolog isoform X3 [Odontomachus brunneus]|uniref:protein unc-79 homolog isoform X3 n=1 Tax=Odontomachus brunneus TaxID=486640 RepID=UPI0013F273CF|nr:protein unc-79 homolog isoform X3 [Odontomachus brunneus]